MRAEIGPAKWLPRTNFTANAVPAAVLAQILDHERRIMPLGIRAHLDVDPTHPSPGCLLYVLFVNGIPLVVIGVAPLQRCWWGMMPPPVIPMRTTRQASQPSLSLRSNEHGNDLLERLAEVGAKAEAAGNRLIVRAGRKPVPGELVQRLREAKADVLAALAPAAPIPAAVEAFYRCDPNEAAWWRRHLIIRTIDRGLVGTRSHAEAAWLAWSELQNRWHRLNGKHVPAWQCAGCGKPIAGREDLTLSDGSRVHFDNLDCVIRYGDRWRGAAMRALIAIGLQPPTGEDHPA